MLYCKSKLLRYYFFFCNPMFINKLTAVSLPCNQTFKLLNQICHFPWLIVHVAVCRSLCHRTKLNDDESHRSSFVKISSGGAGHGFHPSQGLRIFWLLTNWRNCTSFTSSYIHWVNIRWIIHLWWPVYLIPNIQLIGLISATLSGPGLPPRPCRGGGPAHFPKQQLVSGPIQLINYCTYNILNSSISNAPQFC